ncbi:putative RNA methyltransferase [Planctobacterium marinum]|uniref:putative RNA methyltransferase n=1 Tax=Planctobacterium marinum TaxID=1631968 RepID=UPI0036090570
MNKTTSPDDKMHPKSSLYLCPICKQHLEPVQRSFKCVNNHLFDIAKEGYINLLPVNKKRSKAPGDSKAMLLARRDFLTAGYYQCLVKALEETLKAQCKHDLTTVLDLGCGEGFYGRELQQLLADRFNHVGFWGGRTFLSLPSSWRLNSLKPPVILWPVLRICLIATAALT